MTLRGPATRLTIMVGESDQAHHHPVYTEIVHRAHRAGLAGASVFRGIEGFGKSHHIHTTRLLSLSEDLPVAIVMVDTDENIRWTRESYEALQPHLRRGRYVNYMAEDDTGDAAARAAYGNNFDRLVEIKTKYDPTNLFHMNVNIPPRA